MEINEPAHKLEVFSNYRILIEPASSLNKGGDESIS